MNKSFTSLLDLMTVERPAPFAKRAKKERSCIAEVFALSLHEVGEGENVCDDASYRIFASQKCTHFREGNPAVEANGDAYATASVEAREHKQLMAGWEHLISPSGSPTTLRKYATPNDSSM